MTPLTVSVWNVDLLQPISVVDALRAWLDDDEIRAAASRRADVLRHRYIVAHGAVRSILGARLGIDPGAVVLSRHCDQCGDPLHGKPVLPDHRDLCFNLSHSESFAMVAVVSGALVGVDIEIERPRPRLDRLAARVLSDEEHAEWLEAGLRSAPTPFARWTAKEAYLKATGAGIWQPLRDVPRDPDGWTVVRIASPLGTVASIAVEADAVVAIEQWAPPQSPTALEWAIPASGRSTSSAGRQSVACSRPGCWVCATRSSPARTRRSRSSATTRVDRRATIRSSCNSIPIIPRSRSRAVSANCASRRSARSFETTRDAQGRAPTAT